MKVMKKILILGFVCYSYSMIASSWNDFFMSGIKNNPKIISASVGCLSVGLYQKYASTKNEKKSFFYCGQDDTQAIKFGLGSSKFLVGLQKDNFEIDIPESPRSKKYTYLSEKNKNTIIVGSLMTAFTYGLISYIGKK